MSERALLLCLVSLSGCVQGSTNTRRVLFVGNSLTAAHRLPEVVQAMCAQPLRVESIAVPNSSLEDHLANGAAVERLNSERFDLLVLQQGPSALEESRTALRRDAARFAQLAEARGTKVALFQVWAPRSRPHHTARVLESYALATADVDGALLPVGAAFSRLGDSFPLFEADGFHPSPVGTYAAAAVIASRICGVRAESLPPEIRGTDGTALLSISPEHLDQVRAVLRP